MEAPEISGHERRVVHYHIKLCGQTGYVETRRLTGADVAYEMFDIGEMTWAGHEALEGMRNG